MFKEVLAGIRDRVEGTLAVSLIGLDGIAIESIKRDNVPLDVFGAEFGGFIKSVRPNTELNTGEVLQFALVTEKYITFLSAVTSEYFVLLVMRPDGNYGRARFELAKAKHLLRDELI
jgi:predicted regulator of Ras-like GTPase activity (Roadblock/LC7/MglB family)